MRLLEPHFGDTASFCCASAPSPPPSRLPLPKLTPDQVVHLRPFLSKVVLKQLSEHRKRPPPYESARIKGTAVVVDISGFSQLEVALNAKGLKGIEEFGETLHAIFDVLVHLVLDSGGSVLEFAGDALIAFYDDRDFEAVELEEPGEASISTARRASEQMFASICAFAPIQLHGGIAKGELRTIHLECSTPSMHGESQRGVLCVGSALESAVALLCRSERGEILVEDQPAINAESLPPEVQHMATLDWYPNYASSSSEDGSRRNSLRSVGPRKSHTELLRHMRTPSFMAGEALWKAVEKTRNEEVQKTWRLVEANLEEHGVTLFRNIFRLAPDVLQIFSFRDRPNLYESPELKSHAVRVMSTVGVAVAGLGDIAKLVPVLRMLGKKHLAYGVKKEYYPVVGQALLMTLEQGLGELW